MKNLTKVIGPAPSEIDRKELITRIRQEHQRVSAGVETYTSKAKASRKSTKRSASATALLKKLKEKGITLEEYEALLDTQRKIKELEAQIGNSET